MQHHLDEFTVSDIRHTLSEVVRVISHRRWHFLVTLGVATSAAFGASLLLPRQYTAKTTLKREYDPVLVSMMGRTPSGPYGEIRERMQSAIADPQLVADVLNESRAAQAWSDADRGKADVTAAQVIEGLQVRPIETSKSRDVVEVSLGLPDARQAGQLLALVRDRYVARARREATQTLRSARDFFQSESERCRRALGDLQQSMTAMELKYPGIDPSGIDPDQARQTALIAERVELERSCEAAAARARQLKQAIKQFDDPASLQANRTEEPNPRYAELLQEIDKLENEIADNKRLRQMTEAHPTVVRLRKTLQLRQESLDQTPPYVPSASVQALGAAIASKAQAERQLADFDATLAGHHSRLDHLKTELDELNRRRIAVAAHRPGYLKIHERAEQLRAELANWQANLAPINHLLAAESSNRALHFETLKDINGLAAPTSPDVWVVLIACLGIGLGGGVLAIVLAEVMDRSFRTVRQLTTTLSIPIIESIDEIMTHAARRKFALRRLVMLPAITSVLLACASVTGVLAFRSLTAAGQIDPLEFATTPRPIAQPGDGLITQTETEPWEPSPMTVLVP